MSSNYKRMAAERGEVSLDQDIIDVMRFAADLQRASSRHLKGLWKEKGLSERAIFILELVNAGLDRPSKLIEYFDVLPSTITFETDKMVAAGLLTREPLPTDRRVVQLSLTPAGKAVHLQATELLNGLLRPRLAALAPGELEAFLAVAAKILKPIPAVSHDGDAEPAADTKRAQGS